MNLNLAVILAELFLLLRRDILVPEEDDAAFTNQQSKFISLLVREILQLQAFDLCADMSRQVGHALSGFEERGF